MTKVITISSQRYLDDEIVAEKRAAQDYTVTVSPRFEIDGETYRVVLDGHHSLAAALEDGAEPDFIEQGASENDTIGLLDDGKIDDFLVVTKIDSDYYDIETGSDIW